MRGMRWSYRELQETPVYVRLYCGAFLDVIGERQKAQADDA